MWPWLGNAYCWKTDTPSTLRDSRRAGAMEFTEKEVKLTFLFLFHQQIICSRRCTEEEKHPWSGQRGDGMGHARIVCCWGRISALPPIKGDLCWAEGRRAPRASGAQRSFLFELPVLCSTKFIHRRKRALTTTLITISFNSIKMTSSQHSLPSQMLSWTAEGSGPSSALLEMFCRFQQDSWAGCMKAQLKQWQIESTCLVKLCYTTPSHFNVIHP